MKVWQRLPHPHGGWFRGLLCACMLMLVGAPRLAAGAEELQLDVAETVGLRRYGYPVHAVVELPAAVPLETRFALFDGEQRMPLQCAPADSAAPTASRWLLDFVLSLAPWESRSLVLRYGPNVAVAPPPEVALQLDVRDEALHVAYGPSFNVTVPRDLLGLLSSVQIAGDELLAPSESGLFIHYKDDIHFRCGGSGPRGEPTRLTILREGPLAAAVRFDSREALRGKREVDSHAVLEFPLGKSWIAIDWTVDDDQGFVAGLGLALKLKLPDGPAQEAEEIVADFAVPSPLYAALAPGGGERLLFRGGLPPAESRGAGAAPLWELLRLRGPESLVLAQAADALEAPVPEGWLHVTTSMYTLAAGIADAVADTAWTGEVSADGHVQLYRRFALEGAPPPPGPKRFRCYLHFVTSPPAVGALTSPQSMLHPPTVRVRPAAR